MIIIQSGHEDHEEVRKSPANQFTKIMLGWSNLEMIGKCEGKSQESTEKKNGRLEKNIGDGNERY